MFNQHPTSVLWQEHATRSTCSAMTTVVCHGMKFVMAQLSAHTARTRQHAVRSFSCQNILLQNVCRISTGLPTSQNDELVTRFASLAASEQEYLPSQTAFWSSKSCVQKLSSLHIVWLHLSLKAFAFMKERCQTGGDGWRWK